MIARLWLAAGLALATISTSVLEAEELQSERGMVPGVNYVRTTGERIWKFTGTGMSNSWHAVSSGFSNAYSSSSTFIGGISDNVGNCVGSMVVSLDHAQTPLCNVAGVAQPIFDSASLLILDVADMSSRTLAFVSQGAIEVIYWPIEMVGPRLHWQKSPSGAWATNLHKGELVRFNELVLKSGFALAEVEISASLIPHLNLVFAHVENLTEAERKALVDEVSSHSSDVGVAVSYAERLVLSSLVTAGEYAEVMDIYAVSVDVFPFPGMTLIFDPLGFHKETASEVNSEKSGAAAVDTDVATIFEEPPGVD